MAMNVGPGAGADPDVMVDINTTPLIDVMLVLLIMLIITIPIQLHSVNLNMPAGNPPPPTKEPVVVTIDIDFDGTVLWNGEALPDRATLETKLRAREGRTDARVPRAGALVRRLGLATRVGDEQIRPAVAVHVGGGDAHPGGRVGDL